MKVLIACEESQTVCKAFRKLGHEAYSCDVQECSGGHPEWHIQGDVLPLLEKEWDLIIAHPPCTYLTVTGNRWFNVERYGEKAIQRSKDREESINLFMAFANSKCERICIENPIGIMSSRWRKSDQIIQPYEFGHTESKKTALWLKGLPKLIPTNIVKEAPRVVYKSGKTMPRWYADAVTLPKDERSKLRSKTFQGIADAMANQWSTQATGV
jgi:site-specific DNA-cytosine methylase